MDSLRRGPAHRTRVDPSLPPSSARGRERESDSEKCNERNRLTRSLPVYTHLGTNRFSSFRRKPSPSFRRQDKKVQYIFIYIYIFIYTSCSDIDSPRFFQRKEEEEEEVDLESRAHLGFQSLFGYIKHVTRGTTTRYGGYSATYAYVRESNIVCIYIYIYVYVGTEAGKGRRRRERKVGNGIVRPQLAGMRAHPTNVNAPH